MNTVSRIAELDGPMTASRRVNLDFQKYAAKAVQGIGTVFFRILFGILLDIRIDGKENIQHLKGPIIIVSNHVVFYDSFIFHLFFNPFSSLLPLRFMAVEKFDNPVLNFLFNIGVIPLIYVFFGVFIVARGEGIEKNLKSAREILRHKGTVTIFPAGSMRSDNSLGEFKRGAAALSLMTDTPIIPVALKRSRGNFRSKFIISIGKAYSLPKNISLDQGTASIRTSVENLHNRISFE